MRLKGSFLMDNLFWSVKKYTLILTCFLISFPQWRDALTPFRGCIINIRDTMYKAPAMF